MKEAKIKWTDNIDMVNVYTPIGVSFCWLGKPTNKVFPQASTFHGCRETFAGVWGQHYQRCKWKGQEHLGNRKLRICICDKRNSNTVSKQAATANDKWITEAVRLLNILERYQGWSLTRAYKCGQPEGKALMLYALSGSCKWLRAPQLLSLYLLVVRIAKLYTKTKTIKGLADFEKVAKNTNVGGSYQLRGDFTHFSRTIDYWKLILDNHKHLFFDRSQKDNFLTNPGANGITNLVSLKRADKFIADRFKTLLKQKALTA